MSTPGTVVVIGAGHNGLAAAASLARAGRRVLVVERRSKIGGVAASDEFHPGYRGPGLLHDTTGLRPWIVRALGLERHGLRLRRRRPEVLALGDGSRGILLDGAVDRAAAAIAGHSNADAESYKRYHGFLDSIRGPLSEFFDRPPVNLVRLGTADRWELLRRGLRLRRLGKNRMLELLRLSPMCVADWLDEWFENDTLKAALALPAISGTFSGPRSPGSNANLLLHEAAAGPGVVGGGPALVAALTRAAADLGVELRTGARVVRIVGVDGAVRGVVLEGGEEIPAACVAASCDPRQALLQLLPPGTLPDRVGRRLEAFRTSGTLAQVLLALDRPLRFACLPDRDVELARSGCHLDELERAFDALKYRRASDRPVLEIHVPTVATPEMAPAGHAVVSVLVHFAPYEPEHGWDEAARSSLAERVLAIVERHAPGLSSAVVAQQLLSPADLEQRYALPRGHVHHGEHALDQRLIRPEPDCVGYRTPLRGLYLCGSGSHPGGGLTCAPGALAAATILADG